MQQYTTVLGDVLDMICWRHYGTEAGTTELVLEHNPVLANYPAVLPAGIVLTLPDIDKPEPVANTVSLWD